jgi:hypothetical protein
LKVCLKVIAQTWKDIDQRSKSKSQIAQSFFILLFKSARSFSIITIVIVIVIVIIVLINYTIKFSFISDAISCKW